MQALLLILEGLGKALLEFFYPRRCPVCGDIVQPAGALICPSCVSQLSPVKAPTCRKCGKEVFGEHVEYCFDCGRRRRTFDSGAALLNYNEAARRSMAAVKYKNKREYLDFYSEAIVCRFAAAVRGWQADALIPVPIHPSRRRRRGYNQVEELAERLGKRWNIPVESRVLVRIKKTQPQRSLNPEERLKNLQAAFAVKNGADVPKRVILVDDIYTTGSTLEACSRVLKKAGAEEIHFVVICTGSAG